MADEPKTSQDTTQVADEAKGKASEGAKATQSQKSAKTYTQEEVDKITANVGRQVRAELQTVTQERDTIKGQLTQKDTEIASVNQTIEELNGQIEELSKDDPDKADLVKLRREAKAKLATLTAREVNVQKFERDRLIAEIADSYAMANGEDANPDSLLSAADKFKVNDRAGLESLAEEKGWKLKAQAEPEGNGKEPSAPDSGESSSGGVDLDRLSPREKIDLGIEQAKKRSRR